MIETKIEWHNARDLLPEDDRPILIFAVNAEAYFKANDITLYHTEDDRVSYLMRVHEEGEIIYGFYDEGGIFGGGPSDTKGGIEFFGDEYARTVICWADFLNLPVGSKLNLDIMLKRGC